MNARDLAFEICRTLRASGHQAFLVGGCVRDLLLHREPQDYDVATDAHPERVQELFPESVTVGARFGVILVVTDDAQVEVATFRSDISYSDGRHPDKVEFSSTPQEDVRRRDFTINGLMLNPEDGEVLDFVGGRDDLQSGVVRAIGDPKLRFGEDRLRMIRAVRFAARFGYAVEPATLAAIQDAAGNIVQVSPERLRDELTKILTEGSTRRGFELLDSTGLLRVLLPEVARMKGVAQPPQYHPEGDVWSHTLIMLEGLPVDSPATLAWGVLLHDVGKPPTFTPPTSPKDRIRFNGHAEIGARMAVEICRGFRFSADDTAQVESLVANHMRFIDVFSMKPASLKRFVRLPRFEEQLELHRLDCSSSHRMLDNYDFVRRFIETTPPEEVRPPRLLTGEDLKTLGFRPGPEFKEILHAIEEAQLNGTLEKRDDALEFVRRNYSSGSAAL